MIKSLTSLRFVFAFMVFMSHNVIPSDYFLLKHIFYEGYAGVSFFFILSGFILTHSYKDRLLSNKISALFFYKTRIARIYPLHLLTFIIAALLLQPFQLGIGYLVRFASNLTLTQSFFPFRSVYFTFNAPSWSISDEMFFYFLFPFIIYFIYANRKVFHILFFSILTILFVLTFLIKEETYRHALFYINPMFRISDFCIGICLYCLCEKMSDCKYKIPKMCRLMGGGGGVEIISIFLFICVYLSAYYIPSVYRYSFWYWIPISLLIVVFYFSRNGLCSKILSNKYSVLLGEISFGFYLYHQLIGRLFSAFTTKMQMNVSYPYRFIIVLIITIIVSYLSFKYYETPYNKKIKRVHNFPFKKLLTPINRISNATKHRI
jgi:peptidoglycan/LPS O-acetylase OafA/YrhL